MDRIKPRARESTVLENESNLRLIEAALKDEQVKSRYRSLISSPVLTTGCTLWLGAITAHGCGRFWVGRNSQGKNVAMVAHRFGWALANGLDTLQSVEVLAHLCDEPSCQNLQHLSTSTVAGNTHDWVTRRGTIGSPLRDTRGSRQRALALREAILHGRSVEEAAAAGMPRGDQLQEELFVL